MFLLHTKLQCEIKFHTLKKLIQIIIPLSTILIFQLLNVYFFIESKQNLIVQCCNKLGSMSAKFRCNQFIMNKYIIKQKYKQVYSSLIRRIHIVA